MYHALYKEISEKPIEQCKVAVMYKRDFLIKNVAVKKRFTFASAGSMLKWHCDDFTVRYLLPSQILCIEIGQWLLYPTQCVNY